MPRDTQDMADSDALGGAAENADWNPETPVETTTAPTGPAESKTEKPAADEDRAGGQKEPKEPAETDAAGRSLDEALLARARELGFGDSELDGYDDPAALERDMTRVERFLVAEARRNMEAQAKEQGKTNGEARPKAETPPAPAPKPEPAVKPEPQTPVSDDVEFTLPADLVEDYGEDSAVAKTLKAMSGHYAGRIRQQSQQVQQVVTQLTDQLAQRDRALNGLAGLLSKQIARDYLLKLPDAGDVFADPANVRKVLDEAEVLSAVYAARNLSGGLPADPVERIQELSRRAFMSVFGDRVVQQTAQKTRDRIRDQKGRFTIEPTSREASAGTPQERADRRLEAGYRRAGLL